MKKLRNEENRKKKKEERKKKKGNTGRGTTKYIIGIIWSRENTQLSLSDILERFYLENKWR